MIKTQEPMAQQGLEKELLEIGCFDVAGNKPEDWDAIAASNSRAADDMMKLLAAGRAINCTVCEISPSRSNRG